MSQSCTKPRWWIELAWRLYGCLPAAAGYVPKWCFPFVLPFTGFRIPIAMLRGPTRPDGHPGTLIVAGAEHGVGYMIRRFFKGEPERELVGRVPQWVLARTLKRLRTSADLTIARVDRLSARLLFNADYLAVPEWVGLSIVVPEDPAKLVQSSHSLKEDFRIVRRNELTPDITQAEADFEMFYHTMYVPFIRKRHGEQAVVRNIYWMRRIFDQGGLLWVRRSGQPIAGMIFQRRNQVLELAGLGTVNGEWAPVKAGAATALYFFSIKHAKELGCEIVDFGGCRPSLNDGLLRYKRKWGTQLIERCHTYYDLLVHWNHLNGPVTSFLSHTPLIFRDHGGLSAMNAIGHEEGATPTDAWKVYHSRWIPGLRRLYLVAASGWQPGRDRPPQTTLITLKDAGHDDPRALRGLGST